MFFYLINQNRDNERIKTETMKEEFQSKFKRGVSLIHKFDKSLFYSVNCDCGDNECGSIVEIECDNNYGLLQLHFYKDVQFDDWRYPSYEFFKFDWLRRFFYRWKKAIILAFTGKIILHGDFVILDLEHINNFIEALQEGRDYCIACRQDQDKSDQNSRCGNCSFYSLSNQNLKELNKKMLEL